MKVTVYGAEAVCASCVQAPPSKATAEWLNAAILRKYGVESAVRYVDIHQPETETDRYYCDKVVNDEFFYPLVIGGGEVLGEGFITLKPIYRFLEASGFRAEK